MIIANDKNYNRLSDVLNIIKIPLFVLIVFIHNTNSTTIVPGIVLGPGTNVPLYYYISQYISEVWSRIAVPGFFLISGYLFFFNTVFGKETYLNKLKRRVKSLLLPYLFWNLLFMVYYYLLPLLIPSFFQEEGHEITMKNIICSLWVTKNGHAINQFWYIRDLLVCSLISPVFYFLFTWNKALKFISFSAFFLLWLFGLNLPMVGSYGFSSVALFFFGLGALLGIESIIFTDYINNSIYVIIAFLLSVIDLMTPYSFIHALYHNLFILFGLVAVFYVIGTIYDKGYICHTKMLSFISSASFFVYAIHLPWIMIPLRRLLFNVLEPRSDLSLLILYISIVAMCIIFSLIIYYCLLKLFPQFTIFITGGRFNKKL